MAEPVILQQFSLTDMAAKDCRYVFGVADLYTVFYNNTIKSYPFSDKAAAQAYYATLVDYIGIIEIDTNTCFIKTNTYGDTVREFDVAYNQRQVIMPGAFSMRPLLDAAVTAGNIPVGIALGNSLMQGTGASGASTTFPYILATLLQAHIGVGTVNQWGMTNYGVGGLTMAGVAAYVADNADGTDQDPAVGRLYTAVNPAYALILGLKNDLGVMTRANALVMVRLAMKSLRRKGVIPFFIVDPPSVNMTTGVVIDSDATVGVYYRAAAAAALAEGATVINYYTAMLARRSDGTDIRGYYDADGIHLNDTGYADLAAMVFEAMVNRGAIASAAFDYADGYPMEHTQSLYAATSGTVAATSTQPAVTSLTTARQLQKNEAGIEAFILAAAATTGFLAPGPNRGFIVTLLGGAANTGTLQIKIAGTVVGTVGPADSNAREQHFYLASNPSNALIWGQFATILATAVGSQVALVGIIAIGEQLTTKHAVAPGKVETGGGWGAGTLPDGHAGRADAVIGESVTYKFWGCSHRISYKRGTDQGKFTWAIDGGGTTEIDCYLNAAATTGSAYIANNLTEGWHTVVLTVTAKNGASSANNVVYGHLRTYTKAPFPSVSFKPIIVGEDQTLLDRWKRASVYKVISGTPVPQDWAPYASSLSITGGAGDSAVMMLEK